MFVTMLVQAVTALLARVRTCCTLPFASRT
jgi:hypothetical protein